MDTKYYTFTGKSVKNGSRKIRFATDIKRVKTLQRTGHTEIDMFKLPGPMTKTQVIDYLTQIGYLHQEEVHGLRVE